MSFNKLFRYQFGRQFFIGLFLIGVVFVAVGLFGSRPVLALNPFTINWGDISPDINPNPDWVANSPIGIEDDTFFSGAADPHLDPYHGLGSSTGGVAGFSSQVFTNTAGSGVEVTIYYSDNNYDGPVLEGPDLYRPVSNPNPDRRVTGEWNFRINRDHVITRTLTTAVISFDEPVFMDEFIVGSLSRISGSYEHAIVRAFSSDDATGPIVKASEFINISNLADCSTLLMDECVDEGPTPINALTNVAVDPDLTDGNNDGVYENVGSPADDGIYHIYGVIVQPDPLPGGYGRVKLVYGTPIQSIAVSFFPTADTDPTPFSDPDYTDTWISAILAPYTFRPEATSAVSLGQSSVSVHNTGVVVVGLGLMVLASISGLFFRRRRVLRQTQTIH